MPHAILSTVLSVVTTGYDYANAIFAAVSHRMEEASENATTPTNPEDAFAALEAAIDSQELGRVDVSRGSYAISRDPDGVRYLNDHELSISNRDYWDTLYADEVAAPPEPVAIPVPTQEVAVVPEEADTQENNGEAVATESEENTQNDAAADGLDTTPELPEDQRLRPDIAAAQNSPLEDPNYHRVVNGWNQKLDASSQDLSSLVPFCELYAIFDQNDIIVKEEFGSTRYTSIKDRMAQVNFIGPDGREPALPAGLSPNCSIVKVAGDNQSQLQPDSVSLDQELDINTYTTSYKGIPGIGDLAVSRGSAAAQNVKYDLSITMPNPELINERFEYSKLMLMNSPFLIIYGWNIKDGPFDAQYYPPTITKGVVNDVVVGNGIGGFWSAAVINLSNFNFSFDAVGHLVGKLTFLNSSGIFLGTLTTEAVGNVMEKQLTKPSEEVLKRVGGEENQNFIWANGVPWSATPPDAENAATNNTFAYKQEALSDYFNDQDSTGGWNRAVQESLPAIVTPEDAQQMKENIADLKRLGEKFLADYRIAFINNLFWRKRSSQADSDFERSKLIELQEASTWKYLGEGFIGGQKYAGRGREYGPGGNKTGDTEADKMLDAYFESYITTAWNIFFAARFEQAGIIASQADQTIQGSDYITTSLINTAWPQRITAGSTLTNFANLAGIPSNNEQGDDYGDDGQYRGNQQITYQQIRGGRVILIPKLLEDFIVTDSVSDIFAGEDSYIKNMPPFGRDLQRRVINDFREPRNLNFDNFFGRNPKVAQSVLDLIKTTSVISVPVPVTEEDRLSLQVETRTYSEILGTGSNAEGVQSDGSKVDMDQVMIEIVLLNDVSLAQTETGAFRDNLSRIIFHSTDVAYSLQNTTLGEAAKQFLDKEVPRDAAIDVLHASLAHVRPDAADLAGRFDQWKHAILKNGWIVSQFQESPNSGWKDRPPSPIINPATNTPTGLYFLKSLLSDDSLLETNEEAYLTAQEEEANRLELLAQGALEADKAAAKAAFEAQKTKILNFRSIIDLEASIVAAAEGSQMMIRRDMGTSSQDQLSTIDNTGQTVHTIMRQPVYFFLGSVLESLRVTTSNKVKFLYSEIAPRKTGEGFYINIPESSADSVQSTYDNQIANLERELEELGSSRRPAEDQEPPPVMVAGQDTPVSADARELLERQDAWDQALVDYIKHRGQDRADLWGSVKSDFNPSGVYADYTNYLGNNQAVFNRSPNYELVDGTISTTYYRVAAAAGRTSGITGIADDLLNVHAPWVYRIGNHNNYYDGINHEYVAKGVGQEGPEGFMRLWRPEDLDAALAASASSAQDHGNDFYYRESDEDTFVGVAGDGELQSFTTDSFGQNPSRVDYGYQNAWKNDGNFHSINRTMGAFKVKKVERKNALIQRLLGWLNWYPADNATRDNYATLAGQTHRNFGKSGRGLSNWDQPNTMAVKNSDSAQESLNKSNDWYEIEWENKSFFVKGLVVQNFKTLSGIRPSADNPLPVMGSSESAEAQRIDQIDQLRDQIEAIELAKQAGDLKAQFKSLPIRTTYEIPVNINTIRQFLTSEPRAPLHKLLKKIVGATKETVPAIQLSMRPAPSDPTYIDIFPSAMNYDGVIQEIFTEVDINNSVDADDTNGIKAARKSINRGRLARSEKVIVCQFGTSKSLVESFGLSSKIDPSAFSSFRLPAVVGGANMNVIEVLKSTKSSNPLAYADMLTDFGDILSEGLTTGMEGLKKLNIVSENNDGKIIDYNPAQLENFLMSDVPSISKAASSFIEDMMSQDVSLYNTILTLQSDYFTAKEPSEEGTTGEPGTRLAGSKFYGNVLSTFLRTANLTIHGTTGLSVFNLVYLKGLLSGIEGLYLISSVNESLAASTFTTTLECKLIEYTNNDPQTNPIAYRGASDLNRLASVIDETKARENKEFGADYDIDRLGQYLEEVDTISGTLQ